MKRVRGMLSFIEILHARQTSEHQRYGLSERSAQAIEMISLREPAMGKGFKVENCARERPTLPTVDGRWTAEQIPRAGL